MLSVSRHDFSKVHPTLRVSHNINTTSMSTHQGASLLTFNGSLLPNEPITHRLIFGSLCQQVQQHLNGILGAIGSTESTTGSVGAIGLVATATSTTLSATIVVV